ncbi:hypothetical protein K3556_07280 [Aliiroseovarius sp. M344]|uniref:hypothetical protein n=1 Tax=Aliiroseovarius sp. M344 TaxID=2867010 RepID=UPI0021AD82E8|nr:hypothetical protein [Aliiroseovarius sp. M344]UWQ15666.1 hypothetical protein K3556_07280 [Aliiroseovarius sp. M344]
MTAVIHPPGSPEAVSLPCPHCGTEFHPKRTNQMYCNRQCAKTATRNTNRGPRKSKESSDAKRVQEVRQGRCKGLSHAFYETPPVYRSEFVERLIGEARGVAELRRLVTTRQLLKCWDRDDGTGRLHIAHVLDHYCQEVYRQRSYEVLNPANNLPSAIKLVFPAEYYGPDAPSLYEDGRLKRRPSPWRKPKRAASH